MSQRNIPGTNQTAEHQYQSVQGPLPHGPGVFGGNVRTSFQLNAHITVPMPVNTHIIDGHHLPEQYNNSIPYGIPYCGIVHHPTPPTYNPYMNPGTFSAPLTYGPFNHIPYHNNFLYGMPTKIKSDEIHGSFQNSSASTSSGSANDNSSIRHLEPCPVTGSDHFPPRFIMGPVPSTMVVGSRAAPSAVDSVMVPGPPYMVAGSYLGQPFLPPGHVWSDQTRSLSQGDVGIRPWSQLRCPPTLPVVGGNVGRSASGAMNVPGYQAMASNSSSNFLPPTLPPPPLPVLGTPNSNFYQIPGPSYQGLPANIAPQEGPNSGLRHQGTVLPTGVRIYRPHRGTVLDATVRSQSTPYLRFMPREEVAEFVIPEGYQEVDADRHRDMRMDIEHMSYEELLALGDRIGKVSTGLTVETIRKNLKTKTHLARSSSYPSREKLVSENHTFNSCIICQLDFEDNDAIGILSCRHEYHTSCLEQWLLVKNICPVCKSSALVIEEKPKP